MKKVKRLTYSKAKKQAWQSFSKYIRQRDSDKNGNISCYTCGRISSFKKMQAGHFLIGRHNAVLFDERGCHAQCKYCNLILKGNIQEYYPRMLKDYGQKTIHELQDLDKQPKKYTVNELEEIRDFYKKKLEELNEKQN